MQHSLELEHLPPPAKKALSETAPKPLRMMAAKGILPGAKPQDVLTVLVGLSTTDDGEIARQACSTLEHLPGPILQGALGAELQGPVIEVLADNYRRDSEVVRQLLRQPHTSGDALYRIAKSATEAIGELIAVNEQRLLSHPPIIEALYMNKQVRMSTADRLLELAVRNGLELGIPAFKEAAAAIVSELIVEPTDEPSFDDVLFKEAEAAAQEAALTDSADEDTHEVNDDGEEEVRQEFVPLYTRIAQMTISQKIRRAMLGTAAERMMLVRETNRLVAAAAASSPQLNENDAARIASCRNVIDDVLRIIAKNPSFTRNYQVKLNLVTNPRTPFTFTARLIPHLRDNDLRALVRSKNVAASVQTATRQHLMRKQGKKNH